jgi:hypothetical protein
MKTYYLFFSILLCVSILLANNLFAQSESSAIKTISLGNVQVTEPMIAVNPTDPNNFITVYSNWYEDTRRPASSGTTDGGITWSSNEVPANLLRYPYDQADPTVAFDADGNAHFCYLDMGFTGTNHFYHRDISVAHSTNNGANWTDTSIAYDDFLQQISGFPRPDKPWIVADCNTSSSYKNTLYVVFTAIYGEEGSNPGYAIFLTYKRPGDEYFCKPIRVCETVYQSNSLDVQGAFPVVGSNGALYIFWSLENPILTGGFGPASIYMRKSTNGGASFTGSQPTLIKSGIVESQGAITFQKAHSWPYVAINPLDGSLNLVYGNGTNIEYSVSTNGGDNWSSSVQKGMKLSGITAVWNPNITCDSKGKLSIVYYASNSNGIKVYVATGHAIDITFTVWNQGEINFSSPYKYTDYIGIACNDYTYWGVWPAPYDATHSKIFGRYRRVLPIVENLDQEYLEFSNDKIKFNGNLYDSPYTPDVALFPGTVCTLKINTPSLTKNGSTYNFYQWEDENGLISINHEIIVSINDHKYMAMFNYEAPPPPQSVTVYIKNEFKDPNGTASFGGTVTIDDQDYPNTEDPINFPGQQVTKVFWKDEHHRFKAKEQTFPTDSYYRGFNPRSDHDGGWVYPNQSRTYNNSEINPPVVAGTYIAKYRNQYNAFVNGYAPEIGETITGITLPTVVWQYETELLWAPPTQPFTGGLTGRYIYWIDDEHLNPRNISLINHTTYTTAYKFSQHSNSSTAYNNNNQSKFLKTPNGYLHSVYESMGKVWYERSTDGGTNWEIMNNGWPINWNDGSNNAKSPAISSSNDSDNPLIYITYQVENYSGYNEDYVLLTQFFNGARRWTEFVGNPLPSYSYDAKPVVTSGNGFAMVVYKSASNAVFNAVEFSVDASGNLTQIIPRSFPSAYVNSSCESPTITNGEGQYHLAYQWGVFAIGYLRWGVYTNPSTFNYYSTPSNGSGYNLNMEPSISLANFNPVISWKGSLYAGSPQAVLRRGTLSGSNMIWSDFLKVGNNISHVHSNSASNSTEKTVMCYSQDGPISKWVSRTYSSGYVAYSKPTNLSHNGISIQVTKGTDYNNMKANIFRSSAPLYYFTLSTTNFGGDQSEGGLEKITMDDTLVTFGRSGVADINGIEFVFNIGDILVGDSIIQFIEKPDTIVYSSSNELNEYTRTNNFALTPETNFYFSNIYYVVQKSDPDTSLIASDAVKFKAELVNAISNQVVGIFDNITYNKNNLEKYASLDYEVDCSGITPGVYYLRLVTNVNGNANYSLANIISDNTTLAKKNFNKVNFTGSEIPATYDLAQNFPNPFNPNTTIRYQIPQNGIVMLKIYDILGAEVATLVNEEKLAGKYEANFNASSLASGVYIYKIQAGSFINSKKMILLK